MKPGMTNLGTKTYKVNEYFTRQYVQEEIMRDARHERSPIIPFRKYRWVNFLFKKRPIDDPCVTDFEDSPFSYQKNKMLLSLYLLLFIMFDNDQKISKKEKKVLLHFLKKHKKFFNITDKKHVVETLKETLSLSYVSNYIQTNGIKKTMFLESVALIKNTLNSLKDYKDSFKKLDHLLIHIY